MVQPRDVTCYGNNHCNNHCHNEVLHRDARSNYRMDYWYPLGGLLNSPGHYWDPSWELLNVTNHRPSRASAASPLTALLVLDGTRWKMDDGNGALECGR